MALGLAALVALLAHAAVVRPMLGLHAAGEQRLEEAAGQLARFQRAATGLEALRARAAALDDRAAGQGLIPPGPSDAVAAAQIQSRVRALIEGAGGVVTAGETLPPEIRETVRNVRVRVQFAGPYEALVSTLEGVAAAEPALFVEAFDVRTGDTPDARPGAGRGVAVTLTVYGLRANAGDHPS